MGSYIFKLKRVPEPVISIGNKDNTNFYLTKDELLNNGELKLSMDLPFDFNFEILSYNFSYYKKNGDLIEMKVVGSKFSDELLTVIKNMDLGGKIIIDNIWVKSMGRERPISKIVINIVDKK